MTRLMPPVSEHSAGAAPQSQPTRMRVALAFIERRVNVWLRFGAPAVETVLDRSWRIVEFEPGAVCCRVKWLGNDFGTALWQIIVLQAPQPSEGMQRVSGTSPGAHILLHAEGERSVKSVLAAIDTIERFGVEPCMVDGTYWRTLGNRLAARQPLPAYTTERHAAHLARLALQPYRRRP